MVFELNLFIFSSRLVEEVEVDIPKAVLIFLPIVFSQVRGSAAALDLLGAGSFRFNPRLQTRFPQENWDQLFSASYEACKLAIGTVTSESESESSRGSGLEWLLRAVRIIFKT